MCNAANDYCVDSMKIYRNKFIIFLTATKSPLLCNWRRQHFSCYYYNFTTYLQSNLMQCYAMNIYNFLTQQSSDRTIRIEIPLIQEKKKKCRTEPNTHTHTWREITGAFRARWTLNTVKWYEASVRANDQMFPASTRNLCCHVQLAHGRHTHYGWVPGQFWIKI